MLNEQNTQKQDQLNANAATMLTQLHLVEYLKVQALVGQTLLANLQAYLATEAGQLRMINLVAAAAELTKRSDSISPDDPIPGLDAASEKLKLIEQPVSAPEDEAPALDAITNRISANGTSNGHDEEKKPTPRKRRSKKETAST